MKTRAIKPAPDSTDPLVRELFELMDFNGISAQELSAMTMNTVKEDAILQWRTRAVPTITNLRLCFEALGRRLAVLNL